ncbi:MAG: SIMPL domain-containing protein [Candidatus Paceibacterota bacterium]
MLNTVKNYFKNDLKSVISRPAFVLGVLFLLGFVVLGAYFKSGLNNISVLTNAQGITVSGTAEKFVTSDRGTIYLNIKTDSLDSSPAVAVKKLSDARDSLIKYLVNYGIEAKDIDVLSFNTLDQCTLRDKNSWDTCLGKKYLEFNQTINISSNDVNKIKDLSLNINSYINNNIANYFADMSVTVQSTQYFYTKLADVKTEMLNEATKNAFERAEAIANSTSNHAGAVITASQGVFQITSRDSIDTSDYGSYDTSTIDKKITAVVRVSFKVK